jgi:Mrp family chromosome partitioning ATPase
MNAVMYVVRKSLDLIVIDTPSIGAVAQALVLSSRTDAKILEVRSAKDERRTYTHGAWPDLAILGTAITR